MPLAGLRSRRRQWKGPRTRRPSRKIIGFHFARHRWLAKVARDPELAGADLKVAVLIWEHTNADWGYAWPSLTYIAKQLSLDRSTVVRSVKKLVKRGWIVRRRGQFRSNHYYLAIGSKLMDESD